jgi:hypothetical protein
MRGEGKPDNNNSSSNQDDDEYTRMIQSGKSFVQQRIERLYGQEEQQQKNDKENRQPIKSVIVPGTPPVFRHLRQEFREQLSVKTPSPTSPNKSPIKQQSQAVEKVTCDVVQDLIEDLPPTCDSARQSPEAKLMRLEDAEDSPDEGCPVELKLTAESPDLLEITKTVAEIESPTLLPESPSSPIVKDGSYFMKVSHHNMMKDICSLLNCYLYSFPGDRCRNRKNYEDGDSD